MKEKEIKSPSKTNTGMSKRANPLSLEKETGKAKPLATSGSVKKAQTESTPVSVTSTTTPTLTGSKQFAFFIPLFNKELMTTIKANYPGIPYGQLIEKALLSLLAQEQPKAYEALLAAIANQGKL
jgi:hypothetical protein